MSNNKSYKLICSYMPQRLRKVMENVSPSRQNTVNEIRVRVNRPISYITANQSLYLLKNSELTERPAKSSALLVDKNEIDSILNALCRFSVHSCAKELSQGFFAIENGIRVGVSGTVTSGCDVTLKYINALNFRISRQLIGCAEEIYNKIFCSRPQSVLICGTVNSGKTTILRDLCRLSGNRYKVALVDERSEISAPQNGVPTNDVGIQTDVLEGFSRSDGIISAIRTLSPHIIFCDEISTEADCEAILRGLGCGVKFAATAHAGNFNDLQLRSVIQPLLHHKVFDYAVILEGQNSPGKIREIRRLNTND